jgi:hypothetical protein
MAEFREAPTLVVLETQPLSLKTGLQHDSLRSGVRASSRMFVTIAALFFKRCCRMTSVTCDEIPSQSTRLFDDGS